MSFIDWFKSDGDKVCNFVTLAALALGHTAGLSDSATQITIIAGVLATAAHQSFFPNTPQEKQK